MSVSDNRTAKDPDFNPGTNRSPLKQPLKTLLAIVAAGLATGLALFGWSAKAKDDTTIHFANGVQVTLVEVKSDDMAKLLNESALALEFQVYRHKK